MNGIGTLLYIFITKGKIPAYLGSSFAFISPVTVVIGKYTGLEGYSYALGGFLAVGIVLCLIAWIVKVAGTKWIDVVFPPAAMGAIVAVIGLELVRSEERRVGKECRCLRSPDNAMNNVNVEAKEVEANVLSTR